MEVYQLLAHGRWFSSGTLASSTTKTGCHDIAKILLKVALNTKNQINQIKSNNMNYGLTSDFLLSIDQSVLKPTKSLGIKTEY